MLAGAFGVRNGKCDFKFVRARKRVIKKIKYCTEKMNQRVDDVGFSPDDRIQECESWLLLCEDKLKNVAGVAKLRKKMNAELNFLKRVKTLGDPVQFEKVHCGNVSHLTAIIQSACQATHLVGVLQPFYCKLDGGVSINVVVDVVANGGCLWIKVIARNPQSMNQAFHGQGHFGDRSVVDHGKDFVSCSKHNQMYYSTPTVAFHFFNGVTEEVSSRLSLEGIRVERVSRSDPSRMGPFSNNHLECETLTNHGQVQTLNVDVSTMLAYVSSLTNGGCGFRFVEPVLTEQAERERVHPVKPLLDRLFQGKSLVCCHTALDDFKAIVEKVAGEEEKKRSMLLLERVVAIPDGPVLKDLKIGGKIRKRSLIIFGTGEGIKAITVTANAGFVRAAQSQGVFVQAYIHESRALSETKETTAVRTTVDL